MKKCLHFIAGLRVPSRRPCLHCMSPSSRARSRPSPRVSFQSSERHRSGRLGEAIAIADRAFEWHNGVVFLPQTPRISSVASPANAAGATAFLRRVSSRRRRRRRRRSLSLSLSLSRKHYFPRLSIGPGVFE
ncbi:hypothetical protein TIFTF001_023524 [Ficus carica]|uniref:Uncharacterized protein n=1 Tax=Ficus carica TaxID=3494 RepID=A0AA88DCI1_FICCA|nr:hypothetical protein TIFTF001_023524 [Ficus carica]